MTDDVLDDIFGPGEMEPWVEAQAVDGRYSVVELDSCTFAVRDNESGEPVDWFGTESAARRVIDHLNGEQHGE